MSRHFSFLIIFCIFILLQNSFFVHFNIKGIVPNLVLIFLYLVSFFEPQEGKFSFFAGLFAGFLLDIFSPFPFGIATIILVMVALVLKKVFYGIDRSTILPFIFFFIFFIFLYSSILGMVSTGFFYFHIMAIIVLYNTFFAVIGYFLFKYVFSIQKKKF